jgi:hypothetical protein
MSPASAAGVLEFLRTKDVEDADGRRTTCLILDHSCESPEDVDEGALLRSHEDDPTDVIGAHGGRYFQYPVQSALANTSKDGRRPASRHRPVHQASHQEDVRGDEVSCQRTHGAREESISNRPKQSLPRWRLRHSRCT